MDKPKLIAMCGLSASGKSTFAELLSRKYNAVIVSSDEIRDELFGDVTDQDHNADVFALFHKRIRENLLKGKNVIADATNITMKSRRLLLSDVDKMDIERICVIMPKSFEDCLADNEGRWHSIPEEVLIGQYHKFQIPFYEEGWDRIECCKLYTNAFVPNVNFDDMLLFNQCHPYHRLTLGEHCIQVAQRFENEYGYSGIWKTAAYLHDIGKLKTQTFDSNGVAHYYGHENVGAYDLLSRHFDKDDYVLDLCFLVNYHMLPFDWDTEATKVRWKRRLGEEKFQMLLDFNRCDIGKENGCTNK